MGVDEAREASYKEEKEEEEESRNVIEPLLVAPLATGERKLTYKPRYVFGRTALLIHIGLIALYTTIVTITIITFRYQESTAPCSGSSEANWSPATEHLRWESRALDGFINESIYAGRPSPQLDNAWHELLQNMPLRILPTETQRLNFTSLALSDGSGHLGMLGVYHQLHCLKRIRRWLHRNYYYPGNTTSAVAMSEHAAHVDHCLEMLRQAAICQANVDVVPFRWMATADRVGPTMQEGTLHRCVDWEALEAWAATRRVNLFEEGVLERPVGL